jgi:hypothetical protein
VYSYVYWPTTMLSVSQGCVHMLAHFARTTAKRFFNAHFQCRLSFAKIAYTSTTPMKQSLYMDHKDKTVNNLPTPFLLVRQSPLPPPTFVHSLMRIHPSIPSCKCCKCQAKHTRNRKCKCKHPSIHTYIHSDIFVMLVHTRTIYRTEDMN